MAKTVSRVPGYMVGREHEWEESFVRKVKAGNVSRFRPEWDADAPNVIRWRKREQRKAVRLESKRALRAALKEAA